MRLVGLFIALTFGALTFGLCPTTAALAAAPIEAYGALPTVERPQLSPSGKFIALFYNKDQNHYMVIRRADGDHGIVRTSKLSDRIGGAKWADDDHIYTVTHRTLDTGTDYVHEYPFFFLINIKTGTSKQLDVDEAKPILGIPSVIVHKDGHTFGYLDAGKYLLRQDIDSGQIVEVGRAGENQCCFALTPDAEVKARMQFLDHGRKWSILKGLESDKVLAEGHEEVGSGELLGLGRTPDTVIVADNQNGSRDGVREINLNTGAVSESLVKGAVDVGVIHDQRSFLLIGFHIGGFVDEAYFLDPDLEQKWRSVQAAFKGQKVSLQSSNDDHTRWIVQVEGDHNAGEFYLVDLAAHTAQSLDKIYPDIKAADVGAFSWFDYKAADGTPLKALLTLPPGYTLQTAHNLAAVVLPHGGPQARDRFGFDWWAQALASRGYVVIQPEYRGSGGFGQKFEQAGWGQWGKLMQTDVSDAFKAVAAQGLVDPKRTCIVGWSYGGYATMAAATLQPGLYRCAAAGAGISDISVMLTSEGDRYSGDRNPTVRYWRRSMGVSGASDPKIAEFSPIKHVAAVQGPLMLIHGREDTTVPLEQSELMAKAMRAAGKPVELVILEKETHHIEEASTRTKMLQAMIGFLERNNPPDPLPAAH